MKLSQELKQRHLIKQTTSDDLYKILDNDKINFYLGIDPTADTLHIGHLVPLIMAKRLEQKGHKPIILVGEMTAMVGDPSGKNSERKLMDILEIQKNTNNIKKFLNNFFENNVKIVSNYDWFSKISLVDFFRVYGKYFNLNMMLGKDMIKKRLETGISYTEFSYQIMQAIDFLHLFENENCLLQIGGSEQWGNIVSGIDLIRKKTMKESYGITLPLVTKEDGTKFGKSEKGNIWLRSDKTNVYDFYQFWLNRTDEEAIKFLKIYSFLDLEEISNLEKDHKKEPFKRIAQKELAKQMTIMIHSEKGYETAIKITNSLFTGNVNELEKQDIEIIAKTINHINAKENDELVVSIANANIGMSRREIREFIKNKALKVNGKIVYDENYKIIFPENNEYLFIKLGKKKHLLIKKEN